MDFRFHGGRASVNFTATVGKRWHDGGFERLSEPAALGRWFTEAGLTEDDPHCSLADLRHARQLREAIYRLMLARMGRARPMPDDVATVNAWATKPPPTIELRTTASGLRVQRAQVTTPALLAQLARDAVDTIGDADGHRLRECTNPECSLLFVDTSRAGTRRWCSMSACGSRDKMARYRSNRN
ncbi:CGNR zinc finger domain-containing protein [Micromonospora sp. BQ11]|uniref:CGNR zinc finger domain-containing protein n=1 Tax=Micromonospora sp. BQ11 TaxID=3452212 RepID=UPI003F8CA455